MSEYIPYRFEVNLFSDDNMEQLVCSAAFSEVSGLEASMSPVKIKEGGRNWGEVQLAGPTTFPAIVLKRGMTDVHDGWLWFQSTTMGANYGYRLQGEINVLAPHDDTRVLQQWRLYNAMATKFKGPDLSASASSIAIEELHLVHDGLTFARPDKLFDDEKKSGVTGGGLNE